MREYKLVIPGVLPGLNEYIAAERASRYKGAGMKQQYTHLVAALAKRQLRGLKIVRPVVMEYHFFEKNRYRDKSNISAFARKCIEDGLIAARVLKNDGWKEISGYEDFFAVDKSEPRIEVVLREVEE